jgi:hypothetical protein
MSAASDWLESEWIKWGFTTTAMGTRPTGWYVALHTADPGETGTTGEAAYSGYARQSATFTQTNNQVATNNAQTFAAMAGSSSTITHFSIWDAVSSGNCLAKGALSVSKTFAVGDVPSFGTGEILVNVN